MTVRLDSTSELVAQVSDKSVSLQDVAQAVRRAAEDAEPLNPLVEGWQSGLVDRATSCVAGPLHGLPVVAKDVFDVAGMATSGGTAALAGRVAETDAGVVARLREAGAFIAAKNTMHELSFGITTNNAFSGAARNPFDPTRIPGGSSGGTAVAVAAGIAPVGLAADTGGSSRIPAAYCGLVGFRPSHGRYPADGIVPISHTRDTAGVIARTVREVARVDQVLAGENPSAFSAADLRGLRFGAPKEFWDDLHPDVEYVCEAALDALTVAGAVIVDVTVHELQGFIDEIAVPICLAEMRPDLSEHLERTGGGVTVEEVAEKVSSPDVAALMTAVMGWEDDAEAHRALMEKRAELQRAYARLLDEQRLAALVFPTTPCPPPPIGDDETTVFLGQEVPTFPLVVRHANLGGVAGHPGISVPAGKTSTGLPVGIELDARIDADRELLSVAAALEELLRPAALTRRN